VERLGGRSSKLGTEIPAIGTEFLDGGGGGADSDVEVFKNTIVNKVYLDVLVAAILTGGDINLTQKVEFRTACFEVVRERIIGLRGVVRLAAGWSLAFQDVI
jgi:hypothetical protein